MTTNAETSTVSSNLLMIMTKINGFIVGAKQLLRSPKLQSLKKIPNFKSKPVIAIIIAVVVILGVVFFVRSRGNDFQNADNTFISEGSKLALNKKFSVPIRNSKGETVGSDLVVSVTTLERTSEVLYKGKPLVARSSKDFLVINLEVENSTNNRLTVRPVDFFRLVDASGKTYAPDIQTDAVKVEPFSSKRTRTIYIISEEQKTIKLMIGEIKSENKETVDISI